MEGNYDNVAAFYDVLSRVVFGRAILNAHSYLVTSIRANSKILIAGGGTGVILEQISAIHSSRLQITYVELSAKMISLSRKRNVKNNHVTFLNCAIQDIHLSPDYNIIITPFLFDNFSQTTACTVFNKLNSLLMPEGLWLFSDFQLAGKNRYWQYPLLKLMYLFFKITCGIETFALPNIELLFNQGRLNVISKKYFYKQFICATVYCKQSL